MNDYSSLTPNEKTEILADLSKDAAKHALVLQNLKTWPDASKFYFVKSAGGLSYLHISGHPAHQMGNPTLVIDGDPDAVKMLLQEVDPKPPFAVRESSAALEDVLRSCFPNSKGRPEYRMDVHRASFQPQHKGKSRQLNESDLPALCNFMGAPPQAAPRFIGWLKGARVFYGIEEGGELRAIGSSMVCLPEIFNIVSIETHKGYRGKGYATELTSALVAKCLEFTNDVCLTVFADNAPALRVYEKLGFQIKQERMWMDCE